MLRGRKVSPRWWSSSTTLGGLGGQAQIIMALPRTLRVTHLTRSCSHNTSRNLSLKHQSHHQSRKHVFSSLWL